MSQPRIIVTRRLPAPVQDRLRDNFTVAFNRSDDLFPSAKLIRAMSEADGIVCSPNDLFSEDILLAGPARRTRIIANIGIATDNIDLDAAENAKIAVTNAPTDSSGDVADLAMALILSCARRTTHAEKILRSGAWAESDPSVWTGLGLNGKVLGLIGLGPTGLATARRAALGFGMQVRYYDPAPVKLPNFAIEACSSIQELLENSDFVSLHPSSVPGKEPVLDGTAIGQMKYGASLINTADGRLIDEPALIQALRAGKLSGAGLDVHPDQPQISKAMLDLDNVTLLPHIGTATRENQIRMGMAAVDSLLAFFSGATVPSRVV